MKRTGLALAVGTAMIGGMLGPAAPALLIHELVNREVALIDHALVMGATGVPTPNSAELAASTWYLDQSGFVSSGPGSVVALTTPEAGNNASYLTGEQDLFNAVEAAWHNGTISASDPLYIFGYSQSATIASIVMPEFASGTGTNATADTAYAPGAGDVIPSSDLDFVFIGNPASDPDNIGGVAGTDGYMNVYGAWAALDGYPSIDGAKTPNDLYPVDSVAFTADNWARATNPLDLSPIEHLWYYGVPYQTGAYSPSEIFAHTTETQTGLATYFVLPDSFSYVNQASLLADADDIANNVIPGATSPAAVDAATAVDPATGIIAHLLDVVASLVP